ncbi:MAG: hypothetical protein LBG28_10370 [Tannerella sp.]|nr:hypothetical protein [Tannerella sp.]
MKCFIKQITVVKNSFTHMLFRLAAHLFAVVCMNIRLQPLCVSGRGSEGLQRRTFRPGRNRDGSRVAQSVFRPTARNGVRRRLPNRKAGATANSDFSVFN